MSGCFLPITSVNRAQPVRGEVLSCNPALLVEAADVVPFAKAAAAFNFNYHKPPRLVPTAKMVAAAHVAAKEKPIPVDV